MNAHSFGSCLRVWRLAIVETRYCFDRDRRGTLPRLCHPDASTAACPLKKSCGGMTLRRWRETIVRRCLGRQEPAGTIRIHQRPYPGHFTRRAWCSEWAASSILSRWLSSPGNDGSSSRPRRTWGDCYGYVLVATGRADVMLDPVMNLWDCAPLLPIMEEAGGTFTDWRGVRTANGGNSIATNGLLFDEVMQLVSG